MEAEAFRWNARALKRMAVFLAAISLIGLAMIYGGDAGARMLGVVWLAGFLLFAWDTVRKGSVREPVVTVGPAGIGDTRIRLAPFPWEAIARVETLTVEHLPLLGLDFRDPVAALRDAAPLVRWTAPVHRLFRLPSVTISMGLLGGSRDDLIAAIRRHAPGVEIVEE